MNYKLVCLCKVGKKITILFVSCENIQISIIYLFIYTAKTQTSYTETPSGK